MTDSQLTELNRMIAVMEASKTQEIESCNRDDPDAWVYIEGRIMRWNWEHCDYRVKPVEPKRVWILTKNGNLTNQYTQYDSGLESAEFIELTPSVRQKLGL